MKFLLQPVRLLHPVRLIDTTEYLIGTTNMNLQFLQQIFVYLLFEYFAR